MLDGSRTLVLAVSIALVSGGAVLATGLFASPLAQNGAGSDFGLDTNGNGKFDWLVVDASVNLPETGMWDLGATLFSETRPQGGACDILYVRPLAEVASPDTQWPISYAYERYFFMAGPQTVRIAFPGTEIFRAGVDGPYHVAAHLSLGGYVMYDASGILPGPMPPTVTWNYTTGAYRAADFEEPFRPVFFLGGSSDVAVDVDADGLHDFLELRAPVHVNTAGTYSVQGTLSQHVVPGTDPYYMTIAYAYHDVTLDVGDSDVYVRFRGDQIRMSAIDGPWDFILTLYGGYILADGRANQSGAFGHPGMIYPESLCGTTSAYRASAFDDTVELLRYTGVFEEAVPDFDGDRLYDALIVRAEVEVFVTSSFDMVGVLWSGDRSRAISEFRAQAWIPEGTAWTEWFFAGGDISASGVDGPYLAHLSMTPTANIDPETTYRTTAYRAAEFDDFGRTNLSYWISGLRAESSSPSSVEIFVGVQRGHDALTVVMEDVLTVVVYDSERREVFRSADRVYLPSGGSAQAFAYKVDGLVAGTYVVVATLGPPDRPVDMQSVTVTL